ncbi:dimethyladenosine transferase [Globomyces sp. JEL0801]|nr:dimethyladenosine transferase [Globomyces sp. JEL0801]
MFQREFALRLVAKPGDSLYCRLSANVQLLAKVDHIMKVQVKVDFDEWDGLLRILFNRKNKTVSSSFKSTPVLEMLEHNYKTIASLNGQIVPDEFNIKEEINKVIESSGFDQQRPAKMDNDDFLL